MTCFALREHNYVSSYADSSHIETWEVVLDNLDVIDTSISTDGSKLDNLDVIKTSISTDGSNYLIKAITKEKNKKDDGMSQDVKLIKCSLSWKNNIAMNQFSLCKSTRKSICALNSRISEFYRLYSGLLNVGTYYLIAHRNCVSLYDLRQSETNNQYCETISFYH